LLAGGSYHAARTLGIIGALDTNVAATEYVKRGLDATSTAQLADIGAYLAPVLGRKLSTVRYPA